MKISLAGTFCLQPYKYAITQLEIYINSCSSQASFVY